MMTSKITLAVTMRFTLAAILALCVTPALLAQSDSTGMPHIENARVEQRAVSASIAAEVRKVVDQSAQPQWIGYAVPEVASDRDLCCSNHGGNWENAGCGVCRLEDGNHGAVEKIVLTTSGGPFRTASADEMEGDHVPPATSRTPAV